MRQVGASAGVTGAGEGAERVAEAGEGRQCLSFPLEHVAFISSGGRAILLE